MRYLINFHATSEGDSGFEIFNRETRVYLGTVYLGDDGNVYCDHERGVHGEDLKDLVDDLWTKMPQGVVSIYNVQGTKGGV